MFMQSLTGKFASKKLVQYLAHVAGLCL